MAIAEAQLETWAQQGKTGQFTDTYKSIRGNLLDGSAPYPVDDVEVFLQGSYGNDTNVWADSDVDIVLSTPAPIYHDLSQFPQDQQNAIRERASRECVIRLRRSSKRMPKATSSGSTTAYRSARRRPRSRATTAAGTRISSSASSSDAILVRARHTSGTMKAWRSSQRHRIDNFPKQHSANLTSKHQATKRTSSRWSGSSRTCGIR